MVLCEINLLTRGYSQWPATNASMTRGPRQIYYNAYKYASNGSSIHQLCDIFMHKSSTMHTNMHQLAVSYITYMTKCCIHVIQCTKYFTNMHQMAVL